VCALREGSPVDVHGGHRVEERIADFGVHAVDGVGVVPERVYNQTSVVDAFKGRLEVLIA
jgi:hypothetical protein